MQLILLKLGDLSMKAKKAIQHDYEKIHSYLLEYNYKAIIEDDELKLRLKQIHKAAYIFYIWKIGLRENGITNNYIEEIISTFIQIIYVSIYKDVKILYMLYRNIIDNFIKVCRSFHGIDDYRYTLQVIEEIINLPLVASNTVLINSYRSILNLYKICCGYVHTTREEYFSMHDSVRGYSTAKGVDFIKCVNDFYNLIKCINYILMIYHKNVYEHMRPEEKSLVNYFCNKKELKKIYSYFYGVKY